jgi:hypothetical protein
MVSKIVHLFALSILGFAAQYVGAEEVVGWQPGMIMGTIVHVASGFVFPPSDRDFNRQPPHNYTSNGDDASINFTSDDKEILVTLYAYPRRNDSLRQEFEAIMAEVKKRLIPTSLFIEAQFICR